MTAKSVYAGLQTDVKPGLSDTLLTDGGSVEIVPLISFLQRGVDHVYLFFISSVHLSPSSEYNPTTDIYTGREVDEGLASYFGVFPASRDRSFADKILYEYSKNQVFSEDDFPKIVQLLQKAQQRGLFPFLIDCLC